MPARQLALRCSFGYSACMLSVLIETRNDEDGLAQTLASLIGGAIEGVVREVIVCDNGSTDQTGKVADQYAAPLDHPLPRRCPRAVALRVAC